RSSRTVLPEPLVDGVQAERLPAPSTPRYCTSVSPSAVTAGARPVAGTDQLVPPLVDVRYWYPLRPAPPASVDPPAVIVVEAALRQISEPPVTVGAVGRVRSMWTVLPAVAVAGAQAEVRPD